MPQFFLNKRLILLLVSIIVLVALIGFSLKEDRKLTWPEQFINDATGLFQTIFHRPAQYVAGLFENVNDLKNTYDENSLLKSRLDEYMQLEADLQHYKTENEKLKKELGVTTDLREYNPLIATLIDRNPDRWFENIKIDKGKQDGVRENMAVVTAQGLIGKIKKVSEFTSTVQLLSSPDRQNRISAVVIQDKENASGIIEGYDEEREALVLRRIISKATIEKGQKVETSGNGGVFPKGLLIGEVIEVEPDSYGLTRKAYIKPSAQFDDITNVWVTKLSPKRESFNNDDETEEENK
ncbi:rod shape-determining protein MreC [Metabacillus fastidiosus]|uniref:rod shape-determining protein MreC n=1 Tax=Metabacillus fastidiosus TaxID=1458 RepID=UPI002E251BF5|nr:rod shape-determining protein MreC [Metabacillus fastidiosus]MED4453337.1 rod shape-determining protein MreC [Metabacillus fastidiosus]